MSDQNDIERAVLLSRVEDLEAGLQEARTQNLNYDVILLRERDLYLAKSRLAAWALREAHVDRMAQRLEVDRLNEDIQILQAERKMLKEAAWRMEKAIDWARSILSSVRFILGGTGAEEWLQHYSHEANNIGAQIYGRKQQKTGISTILGHHKGSPEVRQERECQCACRRASCQTKAEQQSESRGPEREGTCCQQSEAESNQTGPSKDADPTEKQNVRKT